MATGDAKVDVCRVCLTIICPINLKCQKMVLPAAVKHMFTMQPLSSASLAGSPSTEGRCLMLLKLVPIQKLQGLSVDVLTSSSNDLSCNKPFRYREIENLHDMQGIAHLIIIMSFVQSMLFYNLG